MKLLEPEIRLLPHFSNKLQIIECILCDMITVQYLYVISRSCARMFPFLPFYFFGFLIPASKAGSRETPRCMYRLYRERNWMLPTRIRFRFSRGISLVSSTVSLDGACSGSDSFKHQAPIEPIPPSHPIELVYRHSVGSFFCFST